jgi:RNA polymerase sporulation-specific sigma factor
MWTYVSHNFESPFYYISYALSTLTSFQLWSMAKRDREGALSLDAPTDEDGGDLQAFLGSADANTEREALRRTELRELFALLTERERQVLFLRYFRDQTQSEVGRRLGLSQVQISRIEKKALLRMRQQGDKA